MKSRIADLIERIEAGERITPAELRRTHTLIALDAIVDDERFVAEHLARHEAADETVAARNA